MVYASLCAIRIQSIVPTNNVYYFIIRLKTELKSIDEKIIIWTQQRENVNDKISYAGIFHRVIITCGTILFYFVATEFFYFRLG